MPADVFLIETGQTASAATLELALEKAELRVSKLCCWHALQPEELIRQKPKLIIVNAVTQNECARNFFLWLRDKNLGAATFAIVPSDDPELIRLAAGLMDDFLLWPLHHEELQQRLLRLVGSSISTVEETRSALIEQLGLRQIVGQDPAFTEVLMKLSALGRSEAGVLLTGETGTGKELCARAVHLLSRRRNGPFIPVECGSIPEHLFENEIFGHAKGAFTDARTEQKGLVTLARGGTLFLDEIDSLSAGMQAKLLRLLQEQSFRPLGADAFLRADVRVVAATNCDLAELVHQNRFRSDLFFRLDVLRVHIPSLRERPSDIALLARHFVFEICEKDRLAHMTLTPAAIRKLEAHIWPGNVRELYNVVHRAALSANGTEIVAAHIDLAACKSAKAIEPEDDGDLNGTFRQHKLRAIERFEKGYVQSLLEQHRGNVTRAAESAGQDRRAFGRLAKKYGLSQTQN